jgi:hypothetical protein
MTSETDDKQRSMASRGRELTLIALTAGLSLATILPACSASTSPKAASSFQACSLSSSTEPGGSADEWAVISTAVAKNFGKSAVVADQRCQGDAYTFTLNPATDSVAVFFGPSDHLGATSDASSGASLSAPTGFKAALAGDQSAASTGEVAVVVSAEGGPGWVVSLSSNNFAGPGAEPIQKKAVDLGTALLSS